MVAVKIQGPESVLEEFNATDDVSILGHCLHELFQDAADKHGDKTAVICANTELSFKGLNGLANRFARDFVERGVGRGDFVGVALNRSVDLVAVLLAVLKTGAAYVPIDPAFPAERIGHMINDAQPKLVVVEATTKKALSFWRGPCLSMDEMRTRAAKTEATTFESNLSVEVGADDLAYLIYTSGSTGKPKGVEISHGALCNLLCAMKREPGCTRTDRLLAATTISFDIAALELFVPLLSGATTIVARTQESKDPSALMALMQRYAITMMQGTPSTWQMMLDAGWGGQPRLSKILCGGEALPRQLAERLLTCADSVWNLYGPTEATVWASVWRVRHGQDVVIGRPIANYRLYVLGEDLEPVPMGCDGELYIGGAGLARGYHNMPKTTQSRFLQNHSPSGEGRLYCTGDLARFEDAERLSVIGRADGQVKIRGYRIEVGDIEAAITAHGDISEAVVVSKDDRLAAYCRRDLDVGVRVSEEEATIRVHAPTLGSILRPWLAQRLPEYMMPAFFIELGAFPMTLNNKVDRNALPDPTGTVQPIKITPFTDMEGSIRLAWSKVLGHDHIGIHDNFFQIGGDSMRAVKVMKELERLCNRTLSPATLFEHYTIRALAAYLDGDGETSTWTPVLPRQSLEENEDIAVVSMACRLPGGVTTPEEYWELLEHGVDATTNVPKDRWDANAFYDADPNARGKSYCQRGGFLTSIDDFDASFFAISPREARAMDPAQRVMLETCWEGFERAGYTMHQLRGSQTGVYIGVCSISAHSPTTALADLDGYAATGSAGGTMSGRVSYALGLEGPALTVDTACSSSLVTTHLACNALRQGECDVAVSGGVSLLLTPAMHIEFSRLKAMSTDGRCRAFAANSQGTSWAEGCTAIVLKRLSDAVRDGDVIHAILRGTAVNHVGRSAAGLTVPSGPSQQRLIRTALTASRLAPENIDYIECHGTATKLGDPIEGAALAAVFGGSRAADSRLWAGSAKSNIGHTQAAAGLAGMIKVILAMRNSKLPKTLHAEQPTPTVDWQGAQMALVQKTQPWLSRVGQPRRAGISAFGIGGTNAHAIVEEPTITKRNFKPLSVQLPPEFPFLLSAQTDAAVGEQARKLRQYIESRGTSEQIRFNEMAFSLATSRNHFRRRLVVMAKDKTDLLEKLETASVAAPACNLVERQRLAMLFTGQGSQISGMGDDLYKVYPVFRDSLHKIASQFTELERPLIDVMQAAPGSATAALLQRTAFSQPALFALEVALWQLWKSWGVRPDLVLGHSVGEITAAHVTGIMSLPDACRLVAARGRLMQAVSLRGTMVSLETSAEGVRTAIHKLSLVGKVDIAGHNTPSQTVASGDADAVKKLAGHFASQDCRVKILDVSHAFHSHHMDGMLAAFLAVAKTIQFYPPKLPIVSSITGKLAEAGQLERPEYWVDQARRAVRFADGIQTLHQQGVNIFLELGPRPVLVGMGAACLPNEQSVAWIPSLTPGKHGASRIQRSLADLHVRHVLINWKSFFEPFGCCQRVELPTYAFQREHFPRSVAQYVGTDTGVEHALQQHPPQQTNAESFQLEINWHRADAINVTPGGSWGLFCPVGHATSVWQGEVKTSLGLTGVRFRTIERLEDAMHVGLDGLVCLWDSNLTDVLGQTRDLTAKALKQLQIAAQMQFSPLLVWVTRRAVGASAEDDEVTGLSAGPLWGMMRTARNEHPELRLRLIDLDDTIDPQTLVAALTLKDEPECAIRYEQVLVPRIQRVKSTRNSAGLHLLRPDGAVLILGGLGDLGRRVALWLARVHGIRDLVLISRRGMDTPGANELVAELVGLGAKADVVACDVANFESLKRIVEDFDDNRPLRGVVHAAGAEDSGG